MSDLKPCPFCTATLMWSDTYSEYHHPIAKCILSGHKFKKGMIGQWNRRALPAVQPDAREAALREAASYHEFMATDEDALSAKYRGGSNPQFAHAQKASWHRKHAAAILALKGSSHE